MADGLDDVGPSVEDAEAGEERDKAPEARMLLTDAAGIRACPSTANSPRIFLQHVSFALSLVRGQKDPST